MAIDPDGASSSRDDRDEPPIAEAERRGMRGISATMGRYALLLATLVTIHLLPELASILLLVFAGGILAVSLDALTARVERVLPGGRGWSYALTLVGIAVALGLAGLILGPRIGAEVAQLSERLPAVWEQLLARANDFALLHPLVSKAQRPVQWFNANAGLMSLLSGTFGGVFNVLVVLLVGIYGAAAPQRYRELGRQLLPRDKHRDLQQLGSDLASIVRHWLVGRLVSMSVVGVAFGLGLWLLGLPLAFSLGLFAGLLSFIPYVGPLLGLIPAILIASVHSLPLAGWVLLLYTGVQLLESTVLTPLIQQRAIALPPAVLIALQLVGSILVGPMGVLMAAPLMVVIMVVVRWSQAPGNP